MFQYGAVAFAHMTAMLVTLLAATLVTGVALIVLPIIGRALHAVVSAMVGRWRERRYRAWERAEALRGIAQLERYLGRRDARH